GLHHIPWAQLRGGHSIIKISTCLREASVAPGAAGARVNGRAIYQTRQTGTVRREAELAAVRTDAEAVEIARRVAVRVFHDVGLGRLGGRDKDPSGVAAPAIGASEGVAEKEVADERRTSHRHALAARPR